MSLLSDEFYANLAKTPRMTGPRVVPQQAPVQEAPQKAWVERNVEDPFSGLVQKAQDKYLSQVPDISSEEQIKKFGGVVGSPEYLKAQGDRSFLGMGNTFRKIPLVGDYVASLDRVPGALFETVGGYLPEQEKWDKMSTMDKISYMSSQAIPGAIANFAVKLPRQIVTAPLRLGYSNYKSVTTFGGRLGSQDTELNLPILGTVPTYYKSYEDARASGQDPLTAGVSTIALAAGDLAISIQGAQALKSAITPKKVVEGSPTVVNTQPIKNAIVQNEFGLKSVKQQVAGSPNKYYQLPKDITSQYNRGNPNNTFLKISPTDMEGNFELSVVQVRGGTISKVIDKVRGQKLTQGDFGPEMKFTSDVIPLGKINPQAFADWQQTMAKLPDWQKKFDTFKGNADDVFNKSQPVTETYISKKKAMQGVSSEQNILDAETQMNQLIKEEAKAMSDMQKEFGGVSLAEGAEGAKLRMSSNPTWYSDFYKTAGRAPGKAEILDMAKTQLEQGSGMFSQEYQGIKSLVEDLKKSAGEQKPNIKDLTDAYYKEQQILFKERKLKIKENPSQEGVYRTQEEFAQRKLKENYDIELAKHPIKIIEVKESPIVERYLKNPNLNIEARQEMLKKSYGNEITIKINRTMTDNEFNKFIKNIQDKLPKTNIGFREKSVGLSNFIERKFLDDGSMEIIFDLNKATSIAKKSGYEINYNKELINSLNKYREDIVKAEEVAPKKLTSGEPPTPEMPEGYGENTSTSLRNEPPIMPKPLKGMENQPITGKQIGHLKSLEGANKIDPALTKSIIKTITGKDNIGDLTQAEYVKASQVLALFNDASRYIGAEPSLNPAMEWLSPQRYFMKNAESQYGVPIYSEGYVKMENAMQTRNNFRTLWMEKNREVFKVGKTDYGSAKFAEERRLVKAYMEGDMEAITKNSSITPQVKTDMIQIAQRLKPLYEELGKAFGIPAEIFLQNYQPHIQNLGGIFVLNKSGAEMPKGMDFFAEHKRNGALSVQVDDALALADIYVNAGSNKLFLDDVLGNMKGLYESLPKNLQEHFKSYVQEKLGYAGGTEEYLNQIGAGLNRKIPGLNLSPDWGRKMLQATLDTTYSGGLGLRPDAMVRNLLQLPMMVYPRLGFKFAGEALKKALSKEGMAEVKAKGFLVDQGGVYGQELAKETEFVGQISNAYRGVTRATLKPYGSTDIVTRGAAYWQGKMIWNEAMEKLNSGKITWDQFEKEIDMKAFDAVDQNIIRQELVGKNPEAAFNHYVRDIIDQTNFPYRRGASPKAFWGIGGKVGGQFLQFPVEFAHTLGGWLKTGQYDKLIRFYGIATATKRTFEDTFGMDISKWVALGPLAIGSAPFVKAATEIFSMVDSWRNNNAEEFETHKDALIKEVKSLGVPAGVQIQRLSQFNQSINNSKKYNLPEGVYGVYDKNGKLKYTTNFSDLWYGTLLGFPTTEKTEQTNIQKEISNARFNSTTAKQSFLRLYQQGKYDEANKLLSEFRFTVTPADFEAYYIPLNQRLYNSLPAAMKPQFAPKIFK